MCQVKFFETLWRFIAEHDNTTESVDYNTSSSVDLTVHASPQVLKQVQAMVSVYTNPQPESQTSLVVTLDLVHRLLIHEKQWGKIDPTAAQHLSKDNKCKHDLTKFAHLMDSCLVCGIVRTNLEVPLKCSLDAFRWLVANGYDAVVSKLFADKALQAEESGFAAFLDSWATKYRDRFYEYAKWEPAGEWTKGENGVLQSKDREWTDADRKAMEDELNTKYSDFWREMMDSQLNDGIPMRSYERGNGRNWSRTDWRWSPDAKKAGIDTYFGWFAEWKQKAQQQISNGALEIHRDHAAEQGEQWAIDCLHKKDSKGKRVHGENCSICLHAAHKRTITGLIEDLQKELFQSYYRGGASAFGDGVSLHKLLDQVSRDFPFKGHRCHEQVVQICGNVTELIKIVRIQKHNHIFGDGDNEDHSPGGQLHETLLSQVSEYSTNLRSVLSWVEGIEQFSQTKLAVAKVKAATEKHCTDFGKKREEYYMAYLSEKAQLPKERTEQEAIQDKFDMLLAQIQVRLRVSLSAVNLDYIDQSTIQSDLESTLKYILDNVSACLHVCIAVMGVHCCDAFAAGRSGRARAAWACNRVAANEMVHRWHRQEGKPAASFIGKQKASKCCTSPKKVGRSGRIPK